MTKFKYEAKGNKDKKPYEDTIEAPTEEQALALLDKLFGVERNAHGKQTNADVVTVKIVK